MDNLKQKSLKAFWWELSGRFGGQTIGFVISIFLARLLSPSDFGLLAMVNVIITISSSLMDMGLGVAIIQRKDVNEVHYGSVFFFNISIGLLLAATFFFTAPLVSIFYKNDLLVPIARTMSILFILNSIGNVIRIKQCKELDYAIPTQANLIAAILSGIVGITMAFANFGVWSLVAQSLLNPILTNAYLFYRIRWRPKLIFTWKALKELWSFGFPMFISGILDTIFTNADSLIIGKLFSPATLGHYYRARSLNNYVVQYSSGSLMSVLLPTFSKVQDNPELFKNIIFKSYHLICFLAFFLSGLFFVTGTDIILLLFGQKWQEAIPMFQLIIITAYGYPLSSLLVNILTASGNSRDFLRLEIIKKIFFSISLSLGFFWGIKGYLALNAIAYALAVYMNIVFAGRQLKTGQLWFLKITFPYFFITIITGGVLYFLQNLFQLNNIIHLFVGGILFSILFIGLVLIFKLTGIYILGDELSKISPIQRALVLLNPFLARLKKINHK